TGAGAVRGVPAVPGRRVRAVRAAGTLPGRRGTGAVRAARAVPGRRRIGAVRTARAVPGGGGVRARVGAVARVGPGRGVLGGQRAGALGTAPGSVAVAPGGPFGRAPLAAVGRGRPLLGLLRPRVLPVGTPRRAPGLAAGRGRGREMAVGGPALRAAAPWDRSDRHARQQGLTTVGGQHDAFARFARRGLLALSTLRHRDSYQWGTL